MLTFTKMGRAITEAQESKAISDAEAKMLWKEASARYADAARTNSIAENLPCVVLGRNAKDCAILASTEFPQLKGAIIFSDYTYQKGERNFDQGWSKPGHDDA